MRNRKKTRQRLKSVPAGDRRRRDANAHGLVLSYRLLVGQILQALDTYDSDDGHNDLVKAGVLATAQRLEDEADAIWTRPRRGRA